jgi:hypothetical protein
LFDEHFTTIDDPDEFFKAVISRRSNEFVRFQQVMFNASILVEKTILYREKTILQCIKISKKIVEAFASEYVKFMNAENILA